MDTHDLVLLAKARSLASSGEGARVRQQSGLSLREVSAAIAVAQTTLWRWERGERAPRGDAAVAWARLVGDLSKALGSAA